MKDNSRNTEDKINKILVEVKRDDTVLAVFLYGSCVRGEMHKDSDIDISIVLEKNNYTSKQMFNKLISYFKLSDIDVKIFQQMPLYIRMRIIKEGKVLFCRDENRLYDMIFKNIQDFADFEHIYHYYLQEVSNVG